uniref:Protein translocase subunit SecA 2 n=1 Tax=Chlorobium chlorochromatii (strain CaD3) TaxID=340177 RepID=SECA2_CHLCH|nr:RecName: Full=Protein translocase subunit SecA 2 [Chlorobium chlorochromatii CaD3]
MIPSQEYRKSVVHQPENVPSGFRGATHWLAGKVHRRQSKQQALLEQAHTIHTAAEAHRTLSLVDLQAQLLSFRDHFRRRARGYEQHISAAMALIVEASHRQLGLRPFPVQIMGALALLEGSLIEMQTGEGKTLVAALAAVFLGWSGRSCHVITVNDYLASRDYARLEPLYTFCGVTASCVIGELKRPERQRSYQAAVVYVTSKELVADFLKDRLLLHGVSDPSRHFLHSSNTLREGDEVPVLNGLWAAIVDEADSVLVDDAATPLIISRPVKNEPLMEACREAVRLAAKLQPTLHYTVEERYKQIALTSEGNATIEQMLPTLPPFWHSATRRNELLLLVLNAREFFRKGKDYVVSDGKVVIIDEFTGRLMPDRKWQKGTQQIVELLEGVEPTDPVEVAARISFQRFFRFYKLLCGMSGTVKGVTAELWHIYSLPYVAIPTNKPSRRTTQAPEYFLEKGAKYAALIATLEALHRQGVPILVGTRSVRESEFLADLLRQKMLNFQLLNAIYHKEEAAIIARAGERGNITIATNMAGRGTDILLEQGVAALGGLHVLLAEPNEAERIDRQFYGRCARQGDPGTSYSYIALDDRLLQRFFPERFLNSVMAEVLLRRLPGSHALMQLLVYLAQQMAQRMAYQQRLSLLRRDEQLDQLMSFAGSGPKF